MCICSCGLWTLTRGDRPWTVVVQLRSWLLEKGGAVILKMCK